MSVKITVTDAQAIAKKLETLGTDLLIRKIHCAELLGDKSDEFKKASAELEEHELLEARLKKAMVSP